MKKLVKYPSIEQFRNIVSNIKRKYEFVGIDENGDAIYDESLPKPTITFTGTVKLHGTNAGVSYNEKGRLWVQSRENIITPTSDNAGFAFFVESNKDTFYSLMIQVMNKENIDVHNNSISIYGEWCGGSIQKGVGVKNLSKSLFIFGVKISPIVDSEDLDAVKNNPSYWVDHTYLRSTENNIYNINDYKTYSIDIDFNNPSSKQEELSELTIQVENDCPVANAFGFPNTLGEGIVWSATIDDTVYRFKTKGEKHSISKTKNIANVDVEKLESIQSFIEYAVTEQRFNQALENIFPNNEPIDVKKMGELIKWVVTDVMKEEMDTMIENGIEPKEISKYISNKVRNMFFNLPV